MALTAEQKHKIREFALKKYDSLHGTHGRRHAYRTANLAEAIAEQEGADVEICRFGAFLHQYHPEGVDSVRSYLNSLGISSEIVNQLVHCVECVEPETIQKAQTLEAKVVFDADKLQTLGAFGLIREVSYRTATRDLEFLDVVEQARNLQHQMYDLIQTETGTTIADDLKNQAAWILGSFDKWEDLGKNGKVNIQESFF